MVQFDGNVPRRLKYPVLNIGVRDGLAWEMLAADAEEDLRFRKDL
jgi:hypothetical protein